MIITIKSQHLTQLKEVSYHKSIDQDTGVVIATFKNDEMYMYLDVNINNFVPLIHNKYISIGAAFNHNIKSKYTGINITNTTNEMENNYAE